MPQNKPAAVACGCCNTGSLLHFSCFYPQAIQQSKLSAVAYKRCNTANLAALQEQAQEPFAMLSCRQDGLQQQLHNARAEVAGAKAVVSVLDTQLVSHCPVTFSLAFMHLLICNHISA